MNHIAKLSIAEFSSLIEIERYVQATRCSNLLIEQLQNKLCTAPELNPDKVLAAILEMEGESRCGTKEATKFIKKPLKGLWHKHYKEAGIDTLLVNLKNALQHAPPISINLDSNDRDAAGLIADHAMEQLQQRNLNRKFTGEWLVFAKHENQNYYLCLGKHGDDIYIRSLIDQYCVEQFPFLSSILQPHE